MPLLEDICCPLELINDGNAGGISLSMLNALMAGSALKGAWVKVDDHEQGSVGLRCNRVLPSAFRNFAGMTGTSGSEARLMVESGDFRVLVEELERRTDETVVLTRGGGEEPQKVPIAKGTGVVVDELAERYDCEYGICDEDVDGPLFKRNEPGGERGTVDRYLIFDG